MVTESIKTILFDTHLKQNARMIEFAGYQLPIWYTSLKDEHVSVRQDAGVFDISHMGLFIIKGNNSLNFLQELSCNNVGKSLSGTMIYSMFLNSQGFVLDDVMHGFYNDQFYLITNGSNQFKLKGWMLKHCPEDVEVLHLNKSHCFLAVQGPKAVTKLSAVSQTDLSDIKRFGIREISLHNQTCTAFRTGYTGEDGFELMIPNEIASSVWNDIISEGVTPCGLAARDSLRIEKGFPLYGHELSEIIHPFMTQHSWVVKFDKDFIGKDALIKQKNLPHLINVGLELDSRQIARQDYKILEGGYISSGTISPSLDKSIALAFVPKEYASIGSRVHISIRNKTVQATVVKVPFS